MSENCSCGSKDTKIGKSFYEDWMLVEYELLCTGCGKSLGYWSYGNWQDVEEEPNNDNNSDK